MVIPFLWLFFAGLGECLKDSGIQTAQSPTDSVIYKATEKRSKRLITPRQESLLPTSNVVKVLEPVPQTSTTTKKKGNGSVTKKDMGGKDESHKIHSGKSKKQRKNKKMNPISLRQGQSPKRLRQHLQHKKKVKEFLQKRIKEQIEQRNQTPLKPAQLSDAHH